MPRANKTLISAKDRQGEYRRRLSGKYSIIYKINDNQIIILRIFNQKQNYLNSKTFILREKSPRYIFKFNKVKRSNMEKILCFINYAINLIYPNVCGICDKLCKEDLCRKCQVNLENIVKFKIDKYENKNFEKHLYIFKYEGIIKERLINFKFNEKSYIYKAFVNFIIKNKKICRFLKSYDIIIPVPIHYNRKVTRGYNQSALIAKEIAVRLNSKYENKVLFKRLNNKPQSTKNKQERIENVKGVYYTKNNYIVLNKKILLLDDIFTTGSTADECSKILKIAGAQKVDVITIAKD